MTGTSIMVDKFVRQKLAVVRTPGGLGAFMTILMRSMGNSGMPIPAVEAGVGGPGKEEVVVDIPEKAFNVLFSESPENKSIWWLMNAILAKSSVEQGARVKHATGDEFRIAREFVSSASSGNAKEELLARIEKLVRDDGKVEFPNIGV